MKRGEVVRLCWPTIDGKVTLIALTAEDPPRQLERADCTEAELESETARLYAALVYALPPTSGRATRTPSSAGVLSVPRGHLALVP